MDFGAIPKTYGNPLFWINFGFGAVKLDYRALANTLRGLESGGRGMPFVHITRYGMLWSARADLKLGCVIPGVYGAANY